MSFMDIFSREDLHKIAERHGWKYHDQYWASHRKRLTNRKMTKMLKRQTARELTSEQSILSRLTNWQRGRWDRAGRPMNLEQLQTFSEMRKNV